MSSMLILTLLLRFSRAAREHFDLNAQPRYYHRNVTFPDGLDMTKRGFRTLIIAAALIVATGTTAGVFVQRYLDQRVRARQMELVQTSAAKVRAHIEHVLSQDLLVIHSTAAYIAVHPEITQAEFAAFGAELMNGSATLGNLVAAPDLVISFVYPVAGNEGIIGTDQSGCIGPGGGDPRRGAGDSRCPSPLLQRPELRSRLLRRQ
jgi:hypothetical protein